jgi:signal transduction histidine kinase
MVLLTQEALELPRFTRLLELLGSQPPWSDLPIVVLISGSTLIPSVTAAISALDQRTNAVVLERPVRVTTIVRAVQSALRARKRQYDFREHLAALLRAEEAERSARADAEDALRAREEFLSIASHELRNPVAALSGTAQLIRRARDSGRLNDTRLTTYLDSLEASGRHLASLTNDLLDVSRLQRGELPIRPQEIDVVALLQHIVQRGEWAEHHLILETDERHVELMIDPDRIGQVVSNLLENAVKYSPEGTDIVVRLHRADSGALIEVEDSGIGLPKDALESIFTPFQRARNATEANIPGLGLGLYVSRRIVEQHGGRLWAQSAGEGLGTVMSVWLGSTGGSHANSHSTDL